MGMQEDTEIEPTRLLTFAEAAARLRKSVNQARWMVAQGDFPRVAKIGGRLTVREADLSAYLERKFADGI